MSIYIITHKVFEEFTELNDYKTLLVGADKNQGLPNYQRDNDFIGNLSSKNSNYCELTGAYWIMKQSNDDIVGLVHYRRFFANASGNALSMDEIQQELQEYDIILPEKITGTFCKIPCGAKMHFITGHGREGKEAWEACARIIKNSFPEMSSAFDKFEKDREGYFYNMCIMNKTDFDSYHTWLFDILFQLEKEIDVKCYSKYNQRMFGFLSERLLTFWVKYHNMRVKEAPVIFTEPISFMDNMKQLITRRLEK
ncbi:DUF4422 domain-containing protein [Streptococcus suis]|uniref:DUF4422 domain-containing protein n=1 Tax=Streptococcus suis TaxID=1307 RepID=UPI00040F45F2|nr:DUF4422 domain-containing protein [Streptococcus suis]MBY4975633.1 DUF4422 domain-containing protein [Streptococcus suis]HEL1995314.1 DUF4422 domain-containing protein [Streptococcus suis]HEL2729527.1 DUF4422 domain-containing protein [Streptococcus suis]HEM2792976.1 DUF4422 domain-containing protein [Streptococcus suis]